jgi:hypothetical protein
VRIAVGEFGEPDLFDEVHGALVGFAAAQLAACCERERDILPHGFPWQQLVELLEDEDAVRAGRCDRCAIEKDAAFDGLDVSTDGFEERRFAAARRPEDHVTVGFGDVEADAPCGCDQLFAGLVLQGDTVDYEERGHRASFRAHREFPEKTDPSMMLVGS